MWRAGLICYLLLLSIYDIRTRKIPVVWIFLGGTAALLSLILSWHEQPVLEFVLNVLKSCGPGILMLVVARLSGKIGSGDGCVLLVTGSIAGSTKIMVMFMGSLLLVAAAAMVLLIFCKVEKNHRLPFIPFLTVSVILAEWI